MDDIFTQFEFSPGTKEISLLKDISNFAGAHGAGLFSPCSARWRPGGPAKCHKVVR